MCFYSDDSGWIARVQECTVETATEAKECHECGGNIAPGETYHHIFQQENDQDDFDSDPPEGETEGEEFDPGETFGFDYCGKCEKMRQAIRAVEAEEGCDPSEAEPRFGGMSDQLRDACRGEERNKYASRALAMFPELGVEWVNDMTGAA